MIRDAHSIAQEMVCYLKASNSRALLPPKSRAAESRGKAAWSWQELRPPVEEGGQPPWAQRDRGAETPGPHSPLSLPIAAELPSPNLTRSWGPGIFFPAYTGQPPRAQNKVKWEERVWEGRLWYQTSSLTYQSLHDTPIQGQICSTIAKALPNVSEPQDNNVQGVKRGHWESVTRSTTK